MPLLFKLTTEAFKSKDNVLPTLRYTIRQLKIFAAPQLDDMALRHQITCFAIK